MSKIKENPLILVFYLDKVLMEIPELINNYIKSVDYLIASKGDNIIAFFMPTTGKEHIECINPLLTNQKDKNRIKKIIDDIEGSFDIGKDNIED